MFAPAVSVPLSDLIEELLYNIYGMDAPALRYFVASSTVSSLCPKMIEHPRQTTGEVSGRKQRDSFDVLLKAAWGTAFRLMILYNIYKYNMYLYIYIDIDIDMGLGFTVRRCCLDVNVRVHAGGT